MTAPVNWSSLQTTAKGQLDPVPDGEYTAKIIDAQATKSSTDKLMFKVKWEITEGPHVKRRIPTQMVVSEDSPMALAIFFRQMEAMGLGADFFAQQPNPDQVASSMLNRVARITVGHRLWQSVERNEIKGILPPLGGGPVAPGVATGPATVLGATGATPSPSTTPTLPTTAAPTSTPTSAPASTPAGPKPPTDAPPALPI